MRASGQAPPVLAVLVAHASGSWLRDALASVAAQTHPELHLVVVAVGDVHLPDDVLPRGMLRHVVQVPAGVGFARAVNDGVGAAGGGDERYVLLLHDDVALEPGAVAQMVRRAEAQPDAAAVGSKLVEWDYPEVLQEVGGAIDRFAVRKTGIDPDEVDHGQHDATEDVLFASSACLLIRRDAFEEHGRLDPDAWPMYEDVDLCWRLRAGGLRVIAEPQARVRHAAALSRGLRRAAGPSFGPLGIRTFMERGGLRFMLKNYQALTALLIFPQYFLVSVVSLLAAAARRDFWRVRSTAGAWLRVVAELPRVVDARRHLPPRRVDDEELLSLASRRTAVSRRYARVALLGQTADRLARLEAAARAAVREPVVWASFAAALLTLLTLRGVIFAGSFALGELRPLPGLGRALGVYADRFRPEGFDLAAPGGPGLIVLGFVRSLPGMSSSAAGKFVLLGSVVVAAFGAIRLGRALGLRTSGRRWLAVAAAVNPVTFLLLREGHAGALAMWSATPWIAAALLAPVRPAGAAFLRAGSRWALAWAAVVSLHPPALPWFVSLALLSIAACRGDGRTRVRVRLLVLGVAGAFLLCVPWSLDWLSSRTPLVGERAGLVVASARGLDAATFGAGWPLLVWTAVAVLAVAAVRPAQIRWSVLILLGGGWLAGTLSVYPKPTALAAIGWCLVIALARSGRALRDELPQYALGWRQVAVAGVGVVLVLSWLGGGVAAIAAGTDVRSPGIVTQDDVPTGRVLWLLPTDAGVSTWATDGFSEELGDWPVRGGPEQRLVTEALLAARAGRLHRLGSVLSLAGVSHLVALSPAARTGLTTQADLVETDRQGRTRIYRNDAWLGPAQLVGSPPSGRLTAELVGRIGGGAERLAASSGDAGLRITVPEDRGGYVYLAVGKRAGWRVDGVKARPAAAGVVLAAGRVEGTSRAAAPLGALRGVLLPMQAALVLALVAAWLAGVWVSGPQLGEAAAAAAAVAVPLRRVFVLLPAALVVLAIGLAWSGAASPRAGPFVSGVWYCPPAGEGTPQLLAIANPSARPVDFRVRPNLTGQAATEGRLEAGGRATVEIASKNGAVVESFGRRIAVGSLIGADRAVPGLCARAPTQLSIFAEGGRSAAGDGGTLRTAYVLYNPFPETAHMRVRLFTPDETVAPPALQDLRVDPGGTVTLDPESQLPPQASIGAEITVWQGRGVVARRLRRQSFLSWSLGSPPLAQGVLAHARTKDATTRIVGVNPADRPARVSMSFVGETGSLPRLSFDIDRAGRDFFDLGESVQGQASLFVGISATAPVGVEAVVKTGTEVSILPVQRTASSWVAPAVEGRNLLVANPGPDQAKVRLLTLGAGPSLPPLTIEPGHSTQTPMPAEGEFGLLLRSSTPIAVAVAGPGGAAPAAAVD